MNECIYIYIYIYLYLRIYRERERERERETTIALLFTSPLSFFCGYFSPKILDTHAHIHTHVHTHARTHAHTHTKYKTVRNADSAELFVGVSIRTFVLVNQVN
jgi:hypothetical protein